MITKLKPEHPKTCSQVLFFIFLVLPQVVLAHESTSSGATFFSGFLHPLSGVDHVFAMLAIGIWSALAIRPYWIAPTAFVGLMLAGTLLNTHVAPIFSIEPMIAVSVLIMGLLVATRARLHWGAAICMSGLFAFFHGAAHALEIGTQSSWTAWAGMLTGTACLHVVGLLFGHAFFFHRPHFSRVSGTAIAACGAFLLARLA